MKPKNLLAAVVLFSLYAALSASAYAAKFVVNTPVLPPYTTETRDGFEDRLATEMFARVGIEADIRHVPSERGLVNMNSGVDDGVMSRIRGLEKTYPNAVMIDESVIEWRFVAFSSNKNIKISDWRSLAHHDVGIVRGWKILERNITNAASLIKANDVTHLFKLLAAGRIDLAIYAEQPGRLQAQSLNRKDIIVLEPPLATREKFFYVNKKHTGLVKKLEKALVDIKQDGTYRRIREQTLQTGN